MKIGNKIKSFRVERGLSTGQVADKIRVSESTYRRYESDKSFPDLQIIHQLADIFEKPIMDFFPDAMNQTNNNQSGGIALVYCSTINQLSEKLVEQFEARLNEKDELIELLKKKLD